MKNDTMKNDTTDYFKELREAFNSYLREAVFHDDNLDKVVELAQKIGCANLIRYAAMSDEEIQKSGKRADRIRTLLTKIVQDYYETSLFFSTIYGSIRMLNDPDLYDFDESNIDDTIISTISSCCSFYKEYDGIKDPDVLLFISKLTNDKILFILHGFRCNYISDGLFELKELFYELEKKFSPIIGVINALNNFLKSSPIEELA